MTDCLFCKIIKKEIPSEIVFESENAVAFMDINPQAPVHFLVIPKIHLSSITKVEKEHGSIMAEMARIINEVAKQKNIEKSGFRVVVNHGKDSGQAVPHLHFHVLGGRKLKWPPG
ncbi:histidine triad nucleotide-binding protein [Candidatus Saganbacteria bacterium]|nr:histidine triad nucleotide-binding protein [Candidatus Saganbacteria bacterium]